MGLAVSAPSAVRGDTRGGHWLSASLPCRWPSYHASSTTEEGETANVALSRSRLGAARVRVDAVGAGRLLANPTGPPNRNFETPTP